MATGLVHRLEAPVSGADWTRGPLGASLVLTEYVDLQCPCCRGSYPGIEHVLAVMRGAVRFAVRHFPVRSIHEHAEAAAMALEAAGRQGQFWEMYRAIMESRRRVRPEELECLARRLDLDLEEFHRDLASVELYTKIRGQMRSGLRSGVNGTLTLFINGVRYDHRSCPVPAEELRAALEAAREEVLSEAA